MRAGGLHLKGSQPNASHRWARCGKWPDHPSCLHLALRNQEKLLLSHLCHPKVHQANLRMKHCIVRWMNVTFHHLTLRLNCRGLQKKKRSCMMRHDVTQIGFSTMKEATKIADHCSRCSPRDLEVSIIFGQIVIICPLLKLDSLENQDGAGCAERFLCRHVADLLLAHLCG